MGVSIITQKMIFLSPLFLLPVILTTNAGSVSDEALSDTNMVDSQPCLLCELIVQVVDFALESEGSVDQVDRNILVCKNRSDFVGRSAPCCLVCVIPYSLAWRRTARPSS